MTLPVGNTDVADPATGYILKPNADGSINVNGTFTPSGNQRVNAQSGDFVAGSIADLLTFLTLAGTPSDANTVASLMGRLTKIRDLLNSTLPISAVSLPLPTGAAVESGGHLAAIDTATADLVADLDTLITNTGRIPASPAQESGNLATIAGAITSGKMQSNTAQVAGTTTSVNSGTADNGTQRVVNAGSATGTKSSVAGSASSVTILASNTSRKGAIVYNDSTAILYLDLSGGTASTSSYSVQMAASTYFELPGPVIYNGAITGIWASATGNARVTEFS